MVSKACEGEVANVWEQGTAYHPNLYLFEGAEVVYLNVVCCDPRQGG
jgi:hypothetical protein